MSKSYADRQTESLKKGSPIFKIGDDPERILILKKGLVKYSLFKSRKKVTIAYFGPLTTLGLSTVFNLKNPFLVEAISSVEVESITKKHLISNANAFESLQVLVAEEMNIQVANLVEKIGLLFSLNSRELITQCLLHLSKLNGGSPIEGVTRKEIGEYANCSVEYVFRTLSILEEKKIIRLDGKKIAITNRKALQDFANGAGHTLK